MEIYDIIHGTINIDESACKIIDTFEFQSFWLILRVERFLPATLNDAMKSRLINEMYEEWIQGKIMKTMKNLEKSLEKKS